MVLARVPLATKNAASSRRSGVSQGAARKTAREKIKKGGERKQKQRVLSLPLAVLFFIFSNALLPRWALTNWTPGEAFIKRRRRLRVHTYITFISPRIYKSSCIANFSEKEKINKIGYFIQHIKLLFTQVTIAFVFESNLAYFSSELFQGC